MAHFAQLDNDNNVINVIVVSDEDASTEENGIQFCKSLLGEGTNWKQCSYTGSIRGNYPGVGCIYNPNLDIFIEPKPYPSWKIKDNKWVAPKAKPKKDGNYIWNEESLKWDKTEEILA
jgi:hypothetical protein